MKKLVLSAMLGVAITIVGTSCGDSSSSNITASQSIITSEIKVKKQTLEDLMNTELPQVGLDVAIRRKGKDLYPPTGGAHPDPEMLKVLDKRVTFIIPEGSTAKEVTELVAEAFKVKAKFENGKIVIEL